MTEGIRFEEVDKMDKDDRERLIKKAIPVAAGAFAFAVSRRSLAKEQVEDENRNTAGPGEKVMAVEDINGDGINDYIWKGNVYTVNSYHLGAYNLKECGAVYNPYLGETAAQWFQADKFLKVEDENNLSEIRDVVECRAARKPFEDAVRGCMVGGGAGDALGYPVEFSSEKEIRYTFGEAGITSYQCDKESGLAVVSDDTQMTMFTATGILYGYTRGHMRGIMSDVPDYVLEHYKDWLHTQIESAEGSCQSWLRDIPELYVRRAPGRTCLDALTKGEPVERSKGRGGVMRVAPVGLYIDGDSPRVSLEELMKIDRDGAAVAALTHGHPLGSIPAAALVHIINRIVYGQCTFGDGLYDIVAECRMVTEKMYAEEPYLPQFLKKLDAAVEFSKNAASDLENIRNLGEGWVAEEAFAIALYCSLRYQDDFSKAIIAAVNHDGDSDSTGAITGNIVGAAVGYQRIDSKWKKNLEFHKLLLTLADDLCYGCRMSEYGSYVDWEWRKKYIVCGKPKGLKL